MGSQRYVFYHSCKLVYQVWSIVYCFVNFVEFTYKMCSITQSGRTFLIIQLMYEVEFDVALISYDVLVFAILDESESTTLESFA